MGSALTRTRHSAALLGVLLVLAWAGLLVSSVRVGSSRAFALSDTLRALLALAGLAEPLGGNDQIIVGLRLQRALAALGVGSALGLSGAYMQGLFRNALASPGVLGVTAGSGLGAALALALLGGFGPGILMEGAGLLSNALVTAFAFAGAVLVCLAVLALASEGGRLSVPGLLLTGMAMNALCAGLLAALQSLTLGQFEVARAIFAWAFGTLDDRSSEQIMLVWSALAIALAAVPFLAFELDLLAGGEEDAAALGVNVARVRLGALLVSALAAAAAVSVAGQVAFVGLIVPHLVRLLCSNAHRAVLPLSALGGGALLLGADCLQRSLWPGVDLRPGVVMSCLGAPFFLFLLAREREGLRSW